MHIHVPNILKRVINTRDTKLCTKIYIKSYVVIHMKMSDNIHGEPCQLKLNDIDYHVFCHIKSMVNFGIQIGILNIILLEIILYIYTHTLIQAILK